MIFNRNIACLFLAQILGFSVVSSIVLIGPLIGAELAQSQKLATLPVGLTVVGAAIGAVPLTLLMRRFGRRAIFSLTSLIAACACLLAFQALRSGSFSLYCFAAMFLGVFGACVLQFRFAAMESVAPQHMATAASVIIFGGIVAAWLGPEMAISGRKLLSIDYAGSYLLLATAAFVCAALLLLYRNHTQLVSTEDQPARTLRELLKIPTLWLAICAGAVGYAVMAGVMTPTSVSMHLYHGHSQADAKWVIQSHIAAMFMPSLFAPFLIRLLGLRGLIFVGWLAMLASLFAGLHDTSVHGYWVALVLLGVGWNFLFTGGTALLAQVHSSGERFRVQALNEGIIFPIQALASFASGWMLATFGWSGVLYACTPFLGCLLVLLFVERIYQPGKLQRFAN